MAENPEYADSRNGPDGADESTRSSDGETDWGRALRDVAPYLDLGWRIAGITAGPPMLGFAIDLWLQTTPWGLLAGCVFGLAGAVVQLKRLQDEHHS